MKRMLKHPLKLTFGVICLLSGIFLDNIILLFLSGCAYGDMMFAEILEELNKK
jgi:hypothetical protein